MRLLLEVLPIMICISSGKASGVIGRFSTARRRWTMIDGTFVAHSVDFAKAVGYNRNRYQRFLQKGAKNRMMQKTGTGVPLLTLLGIGVLSLSIFAGCQLFTQPSGSNTTSSGGSGGTTTSTPTFELTVTQTTNGTTTTYSGGTTPFDFGMVVPKSSGESVSFTVTNSGSQSVTISKISNTDATDFTFSASSMTVAAGGSVTATGVFDPQSSGTKGATVTIAGSIGSTTGTVSFPVTGDGNSPPTLSYQITVTASTSSTYNGVYVWDSSKDAFVGNSYQIALDTNSADSTLGYWLLESTSGGTPIDQSSVQWDILPPNGTGDTWTGSKITTITETKGGIYITGSPPQYSGQAYLNLSPTLGVGYSASDADGDTLGTPTYQWQESTTGAAGSYTDISGATSATYTPTVAEYFRVKVTPTATAGISPGTAEYSQPVNIAPTTPM